MTFYQFNNKLIVLITLFLFGCGSGSSSSDDGGETPDTYNIESLIVAADIMLSAQNANGSWDWIYDGTSDGETYNTQGATARGILAVYRVTDDQKYLDSANRTAAFIKQNCLDKGTEWRGLYNYDYIFLHELKEAGGDDYLTGKEFKDYDASRDITAEEFVIDYFHQKVVDHSADVDSAAQAVRLEYFKKDWTAPADTMDGAKRWAIGAWGHVAALLGTTDITSDYSGTEMALEIGQILIDEYSRDPSDDYYQLGLTGILEGSAFGGAGTYDEEEQEVINALRLEDVSSDFQTAGYIATVFSQYGDDTSYIWANYIREKIEKGDFDLVVDESCLEAQGEALLGYAKAAELFNSTR